MASSSRPPDHLKLPSCSAPTPSTSVVLTSVALVTVPVTSTPFTYILTVAPFFVTATWYQVPESTVDVLLTIAAVPDLLKKILSSTESIPQSKAPTPLPQKTRVTSSAQLNQHSSVSTSPTS